MTSKKFSDSYNDLISTLIGGRSKDELILADWHRNALQVAPKLNNKNILEIGCGAGELSIYLASRGAKITAIDFSSIAVGFSKENAAMHHENKIDYLVADAQFLPFGNDIFDIIFSCECLEHVSEPLNALKEMNRVLKPGGEVILTTENYSNAIFFQWLICWIRKKPFKSGDFVQPIEHFFLFWKVKKMFQNANLKVSKIYGSHHVFFLLPKMNPSTFVIDRFQNPSIARILLPLARHMTYLAIKK